VSAPRGVVGRGSLSKAKRGKHRWVGLSVDSKIDSRREVESLLVEHLSDISSWRLFDFAVGLDGQQYAIIRVPLSHYSALRSEICKKDNPLVLAGLKSLTSSGKIRLVRQRLGLTKPLRERKTK